MEEVTLKKADLLKAHADGCAATKKALENLYPGVFQEKGLSFQKTHVCIGRLSGDPYIGCEGGMHFALPQCFLHPLPPLDTDDYRPMHSGTIVITVEDGKVAGAIVKED